MAAFQAESQMYPGVADLYAVFTNGNLGVRDLDLIEMCAACCHNAPAGVVSAPMTSGPNWRTPRRLRKYPAEIPSTPLSENQPFARRHTSAGILSSAGGRKLLLDRLAVLKNRAARAQRKSRRLGP